jgi:hypothetical protein
LVNLMKRTMASLLIVAFTLIVILPAALPIVTVLAQTGAYSIDKVDHQIQVMYSGNVVVLETIHVSGQISDDFTIGLPYIYSADVLKVLAYDSTHVYDINLGVQLGDHSGFYAVKIDFNGNTPNVFTVAFVLSNSLTTDQSGGNYLVEFPAYPSLAQNVGTVNVTVSFPSAPKSITIGKSDGNITTTSYTANNLQAYTYSIAEANVKVSTGTIQLATITSLNRDINIDTTGATNAVDTYKIISNATGSLSAFILSIPLGATNIVVRDQFGTALVTNVGTGSNLLLVNATLNSFVNSGQSTTLAASYNLPGATLQDSQYVLADFQLFTNFQYLVEHATMTFDPPEGATIATPQASQLDSSSTLTRGTYQDTLTVTADDISYVDFLAPQTNAIQLAYGYNPVWVSFRPTFWAALAATIGCAGAVVYQKRRPKEETYRTRAEKITVQKSQAPTTEKTPYETVKGQPITADQIRDFTDAYEDRKQLNAELRAMDVKAQKGKIPRRQYKVQRAAVETRIEGLTRSIERTKAVFRVGAGTYPDLINQLDLAEADLAKAEESIRNLEVRQSKGEISIESYKKNISDSQKVRDKAESAINGILLRLREKIR